MTAVIDRAAGSEVTRPDITVATTEDDQESLFLATLSSIDGETAHLRLGQNGLRVIFEETEGNWRARSGYSSHKLVPLDTSGLASTAELVLALEANGFAPDTPSKSFIESLPPTAGEVYRTAYTRSRGQDISYFNSDLNELRDFAPGSSPFLHQVEA